LSAEGRVAELRRVAQQDLGLVARADHETAPLDGQIVEHDHARSRHHVAAADLVGDVDGVEVAVDELRNLDLAALDAELGHDLARIALAVGVAGLVRHHHASTFFGPEGARGESARHGRIDAAGKAPGRRA
jgi:hypothetical protein